MNLMKVEANREPKQYLEYLLQEAELEIRQQQEMMNGRLAGAEHSFRKATMLWRRLAPAFNNPYNWGNPHSEMFLLLEQKKEQTNPFFREILDKHLIFYGVGIGDTEAQIVEWQLAAGQHEVLITGIDVNCHFLSDFFVGLLNKSIEYPQQSIYYRGYSTLFQQISRAYLIEGIGGKRNIHICVGNTIGNFHNQEAIMESFANLIDKGEHLLLGIQLHTHLPIIFEKYRQNYLFEQFVLAAIAEQEKSPLVWELNSKEGIISAKHRDIEIFRSKKYDARDLQGLMKSHRFSLIDQDTDQYQNICLQLYQKEK